MSHPGTYILAEQQERNHAVPYHDTVNPNSMEMEMRKSLYNKDGNSPQQTIDAEKVTEMV
jgi:hypothetical protein